MFVFISVSFDISVKSFVLVDFVVSVFTSGNSVILFINLISVNSVEAITCVETLASFFSLIVSVGEIIPFVLIFVMGSVSNISLDLINLFDSVFWIDSVIWVVSIIWVDSAIWVDFAI